MTVILVEWDGEFAIATGKTKEDAMLSMDAKIGDPYHHTAKVRVLTCGDAIDIKGKVTVYEG